MQEPAQGFTGIWIPRELWLNKDLSATDKIVYANIASFTKACFESNDMMSRKLGVSDKTVSRAIQKLKELGYIYVEFINGNSSTRRIYAILDNPKKLEYLAKKGAFLKKEEKGEDNRDNSEFSTGVGQIVQGGQNVQGVGQIVQPQNRGEVGQNVQQRINKNIKKNNVEAEQEPNKAGSRAGSSPRPAIPPRPRRSDYDSDEAYERALYAGVTADLDE